MARAPRTVPQIVHDQALDSRPEHERNAEKLAAPDAETDTVRWHADEATPVFEWAIPAANDAVLTIKIKARDVETARQEALEYEFPSGRALDPLEHRWVETMDPEIVRDTTSVSLSHNEALRANERLEGLNAAYKATKLLFAEHGIDVFHPELFIDRCQADAAAVVTERQSVWDAECKLIASSLVATKTAIDATLERTRFAPVKVVPPSEPDYSPLTIVVTDEAEIQRYPRLTKANWTTRDLSEPLTEIEVGGMDYLERLFEREKYGTLSDVELKQLIAIESRIKAALG